MRNIKNAFTLAEVLITLGIIGIVAAITIPNVSTRIANTVNRRQAEVLKAKFTEATELMRTKSLLGPIYNDTSEFVTELAKYIKIINICDSEHLTDCFPATQINTDSFSIKTSSLRTGSFFGLKTTETRDNSSANVGIVLADGTPMILSYNTRCPLSSLNDDSTACISAIFDANGAKGPNKIGIDKIKFNTINRIGGYDMFDGYPYPNASGVPIEGDFECPNGGSCYVEGDEYCIRGGDDNTCWDLY